MWAGRQNIRLVVGGGGGTAGNHRSKAGKVRQKDRSWARIKDREETGVEGGVGGGGAQKQESGAEIRFVWDSRMGK